jgi:pimeloyl-ACP methyl ester carboxylesterase
MEVRDQPWFLNVAAEVETELSPESLLAAARSASRLRYGARAGSVVVRDTTIAYAEIGSGRPVVLVHGLGGESSALLPVAARLARRGYRAVVLDLPGCGRSPLAPEPLGIESGGDYALGAAEALGLGPRPALFGHSLGGWMVAWQALAHPERCGPVVLSCAAGLSFEPPPLNVLMPRNVADGRRNVERMFAHPPFIPAPILYLAVRRPRPANFELLRSAMSGEYLLDGLLGGLSVPALVIASEKDRVVPPAIARSMAGAIPGASYVEITDASHMVIWEKPDAVAAAVDAFLRGHPAGP